MMSIGWLPIGMASGALSGLTLRWTEKWLRPGAPARAVMSVAGGTVLRWTLAAALLVLAARQGLMATVWAFLGLWLARWGMVWRLATREELIDG